MPVHVFRAREHAQGNVVRDADARWRLTDGRLSSHQGIAGGRHLRSVPAHGHADFNRFAQRVGSAQESSSRAYSAAVPSVRSNAYVGRRGCMDRPHAAVGRSAAQWCSRGGLECIGQRWRGYAKTAWREEISSNRRGLGKSQNWPTKAGPG